MSGDYNLSAVLNYNLFSLEENPLKTSQKSCKFVKKNCSLRSKPKKKKKALNIEVAFQMLS